MLTALDRGVFGSHDLAIHPEEDDANSGQTIY